MIAPVSSKAAPATVDPQLRKGAQAFEAMLLRQLIGAMRKGSLGDDILGSSASSTYREMADARTADVLAARGAFGIAALIERQLIASSPSPSGEGERDLVALPLSRTGVRTDSPRAMLTVPTPTPPLTGMGFEGDSR